MCLKFKANKWIWWRRIHSLRNPKSRLIFLFRSLLNNLEAEIKRLKSENERYRRENLELKTQIEKLSSGSSKPQKAETSSAQAKSDQEIVGSYVPPSMDKNGDIWERIDRCLKLKKDMKKTLDDIFKRLNDSKKKIDDFVDKAFANNPTLDVNKKFYLLSLKFYCLGKDLEI